MAKNLDSYLADRALTRQLYLMRFSAGEKKKVLGRILVDIGVGSGRIRSCDDAVDFLHQAAKEVG